MATELSDVQRTLEKVRRLEEDTEMRLRRVEAYYLRELDGDLAALRQREAVLERTRGELAAHVQARAALLAQQRATLAELLQLDAKQRADAADAAADADAPRAGAASSSSSSRPPPPPPPPPPPDVSLFAPLTNMSECATLVAFSVCIVGMIIAGVLGAA